MATPRASRRDSPRDSPRDSRPATKTRRRRGSPRATSERAASVVSGFANAAERARVVVVGRRFIFRRFIFRVRRGAVIGILVAIVFGIVRGVRAVRAVRVGVRVRRRGEFGIILGTVHDLARVVHAAAAP